MARQVCEGALDKDFAYHILQSLFHFKCLVPGLSVIAGETPARAVPQRM